MVGAALDDCANHHVIGGNDAGLGSKLVDGGEEDCAVIGTFPDLVESLGLVDAAGLVLVCIVLHLVVEVVAISILDLFLAIGTENDAVTAALAHECLNGRGQHEGDGDEDQDDHSQNPADCYLALGLEGGFFLALNHSCALFCFLEGESLGLLFGFLSVRVVVCRHDKPLFSGAFSACADSLMKNSISLGHCQ
ncbi:hypothetical protein SDC9_89708 [bioreactor metagenome]|uniref:Uncharacterized protein n=1 Tax=bioreactor metagenome TaxID=1076179 RepID=A0A644ZQJ5_9ZZZZ